MSDEIPIIPSDEMLRYWSGRVPVTPEQLELLDREYRARAFFVSSLARLDQAAAAHRSLSDAIGSGESMGQWREGIQDLFRNAGWIENRFLLDTIFRTNIQAAVSAGAWEQAQEGIGDQPYGLYDATLDGRTRPTHAAQHGKVYPLSHPYWRTWWPINGINCRCRVITLSAEQVREMGLTVLDQMPPKNIPTRQATALGIEGKKIRQRPDPGFDRPPGRIAFPVAIEKYPRALRAAFMRAVEASGIDPDLVRQYIGSAA